MGYSRAQSVEITPGNVLPQMTTAQRTSMTSPQNGMLVFDSNTQSYWFRQSGSWVELPKGGSSSNYWQLIGNTIHNTNSGGFYSASPTTISEINATQSVPISGAGTRLMWIPNLAAVRAGTVTGAEWDADSVGLYSVAMGYNVKAKGNGAVAFGKNSKAFGNNCTAMGYSTALGLNSTAMGYSTASGNYSTAIGYNSIAASSFSTAMGNSTASGQYSTAIG